MKPMMPRAGALDAVLRPAEELDEIVVEVELLLVQAALVVVEQAEDEVVAVLAAEVGVGRVAEDDQDGAVFLDGDGFVGFAADDGERAELLGDLVEVFEGVGEVDVEALVGLEVVGPDSRAGVRAGGGR